MTNQNGKLACELVAAIRGKRSQLHLSRLLQGRSNLVHQWESGKSKIDWLEFVHLCRVTHKNIDQAVSGTGFKGKCEDYSAFLRHLGGNVSHAELASVVGVSRSCVTKWFNRKNVPKLEDVFNIFRNNQLSLPNFLSHICDLSKLSASKEFLRNILENKLHCETPWLAAVLRYLDVLEKRGLRYEAGSVAGKFNTTLENENSMLGALLDSGLIELRDEKIQVQVNRFSSPGDGVGALKAKKFWFNATSGFIGKLHENADESKFASLVFSCSNQTYSEIQAEYHKFQQNVLRLIGKSDAKEVDRFALLSAQMIDFDEMLKCTQIIPK